jgi:hypothetical protein
MTDLQRLRCQIDTLDDIEKSFKENVRLRRSTTPELKAYHKRVQEGIALILDWLFAEKAKIQMGSPLADRLEMDVAP